MDATKDWLLTQGILGVVTFILMLVVVKLYRDRELEREKREAELRAFEERYLVKAETWMTRHHELAASLKELLESLTRRHRGDQ